MLSAGLPLPRRVFAHGWLTKDRHKISKTTGNTVDPAALVSEFGSDAVRYYFLSAIVFGQDGDFTRQGLVGRYNADLANGFGNLVQRATTLASRDCTIACPDNDALSEVEVALRDHAATLVDRVATAFESLALHEAIAAVGTFVGEANRYIQLTAPWELAHHAPSARLAVVLDHVVEAARLAAWYSAPFVPSAAAEAHRRLVGTLPLVGGARFAPGARASAVVGPPLFPRVVLGE